MRQWARSWSGIIGTTPYKAHRFIRQVRPNGIVMKCSKRHYTYIFKYPVSPFLNQLFWISKPYLIYKLARSASNKSP